MSDLLAISANDPYSSGKDAMTMHLRIKDFVKSKAGEAPALVESKERELNNVIEERIIPLGGGRKTPQQQGSGGEHYATGGAAAGMDYSPDYMRGPPVVGGGGFAGDLVPGGGGSMLFGPGNPNFDARFRPGQIDPRRGGGGRVPEARFDPYGPFGYSTGDPDPDEFPMPGRAPAHFPSGPVGPRRSNLDYM